MRRRVVILRGSHASDCMLAPQDDVLVAPPVLLRFEREYAAPFCPDSQKGPAIRIKVVGSKFIPRISNLAISQIYCPVIDELARLRVRGRKTDVRIRGKDTITDFHGE